MPDVMVTAGIDAAGDIDVQPSEIAGQIEVLETARDLLGHRDRARVGQAAVVEAGAGDDVGDQIDVGRGDPDFLERAPQRRKVTLGNVRQRQILLMADANLAETVALGEIGDGVHLLRGGIAGRPSLGLERERHDGIAGELVVGDGIVEPNAEAVVRARLCQFGGVVLEGLVVGIAKSRRDIGDHRRVERQRAVLDRLPLLLDFARKFLRAELVDEDLDAGLVDIVAPAVLVVGAHDRLDVAEQITLGQEGFDGLAEEGGAPEPPAHHHLEAGLANSVAVHVQADVVNLHRGAIMRRRSERNLELSRQEREFRVQRQMLAQQLRPYARILDLVRRNPRPLIGRDVAHAIAAGLHPMQSGAREIGHRVGQLLELDPVELDVLARGEMAVIAVVAPRHVRERAHLVGGERAVGDGDPQHIGVQLQIDAVH